MRASMNYHPDFGASPSTERETDMDGWEAAQIQAATKQAREIAKSAAAQIAYLFSTVGVWNPRERTLPLKGETQDEAERRDLEDRFFSQIDDKLDPLKLEEADEVG